MKFSLALIGLMWILFLLELAIPSLKQFGVTPRTVWGIVGIGCSPFLHDSFSHLLGNTVPLIVLLAFLSLVRENPAPWILGAILLSGGLLWALGRGGVVHIGASGLIYALVAYLIVSGILEGRLLGVAIAMLTGILYGGMLLSGVLPTQQRISWDGHLFGAIAGALIAYSFRTPLAKQPDAESVQRALPGAHEHRT